MSIDQETSLKSENLRLQKELDAKNRDLEIEAVLEKVRSRSLAMHNTDELREVVSVVFNKLHDLGIIMAEEAASIVIFTESTKDLILWNAIPDQLYYKAFHIPFYDTAVITTLLDAKSNGKDFFERNYTPAEKAHFWNWAVENSDYKHIPDDRKKRILGAEYFACSIAYTKNSAILVSSYQGKLLSAKEGGILKRFARVFEQAYIRFLDLSMAESHTLQAKQDLIAINAARKNAEDALLELQVTQRQLIQSEKMASLGELIAGIAHEIQNPLNFVNNFSEVSVELLQELKAELKAGHQEDVFAIADDLVQNLQKINHHGKRAESIVKGMLEHSRASTGIKEPTDINKLADEYLRLAYHGLRAKDKSFNADIITHFAECLSQVNVVPQDIGRVLLNLFTNAFYAVNEKKKTAGEGYKPTITLTTFAPPLGGGSVTIEVKDNGTGISDNIKDKIMQPFFTTKPSGEGTGLGLSLSYDIVVKGHGGVIDINSKEGEYTEFIIKIPV